MKYNIASIPTYYNGVEFRSRLEARWAAFFDLAGWKWDYEPIDLNGWIPDFIVTFYCSHSECSGSHTLFVEVKPYFNIDDFKGHECMKYPFGRIFDGPEIPADASAAFGINPHVSYWEMVHGSGGGCENILNWVNEDIDVLWEEAGNLVKYRR